MLEDRDRIAVLRANGYDGVTKQTISLARKPMKFALVMEPKALKLMRLSFPNDPFYPETEKKEKREQEPTLRVHTAPLFKQQVLKAFDEDGFSSMQEGMTQVLKWWLEWRQRDEANLQSAG